MTARTRGSARICATRTTAAVTAAVLVLTGGPAAGARAPFAGLAPSESVSTTRPGDAVWISVASTTHTAGLPGHARTVGPPGHRIWLHAHCAMGAQGAPPHPVRADLYLHNHPEQPQAYTVIHPMHWILGLAGRHTDRVPVRVRLDGGPWHESTFVRPRTDWSAGRPGSDIALPAATVVPALAAATTVRLEVEGAGVRVDATFEPSGDARRAAKLVQTHCPLR